MLQWLSKQWDDIKGNAKFAVVLVVLGLMETAAIALTHGLLLWQQITLGMMFLLIFAWAVFMTAYTAAFVPPRSGLQNLDETRANNLEKCGKLRLASVEARRLREQLQMLGDRSQAEEVNIQSPYVESLFPPSGAYKAFYKDWADWQRSMERYRTLVKSMTEDEPQSRRFKVTHYPIYGCRSSNGGKRFYS